MVVPSAYGVSLLQNATVGDRFQFERLGIVQNPFIIIPILNILVI